ncbi:hypothetical protein Vretimale_7393 [Volvox reticuliferus]|uniref:Uncharacterized protein n=1 Tax=Volvox reticuliferus TaxID=1737510 RepID=A0A8J4LM14_9CHLO|nr:hypothetical protein Vretifemale_7450 [Volvox reticuliferus]GIM02514.1 hypothetical protein Vretimale_7393 [Volvox reticuliferus]
MNSFLCSCFWPPGPKIPEEYLRPQGLYSLERVDLKKLKRLIQNQQLAPCHPGVEEPRPGQDLEECPICFLHYPVLNSSLCCQKRVCTECFLQVQTSTPPHQLSACPFCKVTRPTGYLVKLIGARTAEEKEQERVEEQKVIEARIREREEEIRRDQERALQRQQQQQAAAAASPGNRPQNSSTNTNTNSLVQQQQAAGVMAAAAAAASALEPSGGNAAFATGGRAAGRLPTAAATSDTSTVNAGSGHTGRYQSGDRHRLAGVAAAGSPTATVVQVGGGAGMHPAVSARRAAVAAAMSAAAIQQHQQQNVHHIQHPGDRYLIGPEGVGANVHADNSDNATAAVYVGDRGGGHQRRHQGGGGGRRYRLTDYVPAGVVDIAMGLDDINDLMLEQAMYESLAAAAAAGPPQALPAATASPTTGEGGGHLQGADDATTLNVDDPENDVALAAALAASLDGVEGVDGTVMERQTQSPVVSHTFEAATTIGSSLAADGPADRDLDAIDQFGRGPNYALTTRNGATGAPAPPSPPARGSRNTATSRQAAVVATMRSAPGSRAQPQQPQVAAVAGAVSPRLIRTATPSQLALARGSSPVAPGFRAWERRDTGDRKAGGEPEEEEEEEEEEEDALISRRTANASAASPKQPSADTYPLSAVSGTGPTAGSEAVPLFSQEGGAGAGATPQSNCQQLGGPTGLSVAAAAALPAAAATSEVAPRVGPASVGAPTPITLSPVPSDGRVGALGAVASELSSAATGGAAPRDDLLEVVAVRAAGAQHVNNPLYDMWSNSSSATTCKHPSLDTQAPATAGLVAAGPQEELGRPDGSPAGGSGATSGPSTAALARWGVKCGSERSSLGSDGGIVMQQCGGQDKHKTKQQQQQHEVVLELQTAGPSSPNADSVVAAIAEFGVSPERCQPSRPPPPPPLVLSVPPAASESVTAAATAPRSATVTPPSPARTPDGCGLATTPSPRLGLPPMDLPPPATVTTTATTNAVITTTAEDTPVGSPSPDVPTDTSVTTVVTIQTLAAELLRHSSGAAAMAAAVAAGSSEASSTSSHVVTVGMVFQIPRTAPGASRQPSPASQLAAAPMEGPAWVENPDGSLKLLLPADGGSTSVTNTAAGTANPPTRLRRTGNVRVGNVDELMDVPYADYELPSLDTAWYDLPSTMPYIADGGREPAQAPLEDVIPEKVEKADETLVDMCNETDARLKRLMATSDAAVAAAIAAGDRRVRGNAGING